MKITKQPFLITALLLASPMNFSNPAPTRKIKELATTKDLEYVHQLTNANRDSLNGLTPRDLKALIVKAERSLG